MAGSRVGVTYRDVEQAVDQCGWADEITVVLSGGARGADQHGERWADAHGRTLEIHPVSEADWRRYGKRAGPLRNRRMAKAADACIIVWDGKSRGSRNMIYEARAHGLRTHVVTVAPVQEDSSDG